MQNQKAIIIGCGIAGPAMALFLKRIGIESVIYEAHHSDRDDAGVFLGITPNGINILKELFPVERLLNDYTPGGMQFLNSKNKPIGSIDTAWQQQAFGAQTIQVKRGSLNKEIRNAALENGIAIKTGKKLKTVSQANGSVTARFEDGTEATADLLIGCDGLHSKTRRLIFPDTAPMRYTGLLSTGGFAQPGNVNDFKGAIQMIFGEKAFFAYAVSNRNEVWWFNNIARDTAPERNELNMTEQQELKTMLLDLHKKDPAPIAEIIRTSNHIEMYPIYEIPFLQEWHKGNICLVGDAAHATAPHVGQGASLALEDTMVLAKCIRDCNDHETAFRLFQQLRQERVKKIIASARKIGNNKTAPNKFQRFFRDLLLPVFVKKEAKKLSWIYGYKVNWDQKTRIS
jgi:2-polyprenyl-6-methoxyphenol hydroxylase-like FAD-dependent oxidoreductase